MIRTFHQAKAFTQGSVANWDVAAVTDFNSIFGGSGILADGADPCTQKAIYDAWKDEYYFCCRRPQGCSSNGVCNSDLAISLLQPCGPSPPPTPPPSRPPSPPPPSPPFHGLALRDFGVGNSKNAFQAYAACRDLSGTLVAITSDVMDELKQLLESLQGVSVWTGGRKEAGGLEWRCCRARISG